MRFVTGIVARIIFAVPFILFGIGHLSNANMMAGMVPVPGGAFWIYFTGACMLLAGIAIITGIKGQLASLLLALLLLVYVFTIHIPGMMHAADQMGKMMSMTNMFKDLALAGGALGFAGTFSRR